VQALNTKGVYKKYKVHSKNWFRYRSLIGDKSDAIKSPIPKVGPVRALHLLANGFDPSRRKPKLEIERLYAKHWPAVHRNYRISKIVTSAEHKLLPPHAQEAFTTIIGKIEKGLDCIKRDSRCKNNYRKFLGFCANYELNWIIEQRDVIWRIGW
jgi:5'-3' exonuclease